jgi:hypothetical protein
MKHSSLSAVFVLLVASFNWQETRQFSLARASQFQKRDARFALSSTLEKSLVRIDTASTNPSVIHPHVVADTELWAELCPNLWDDSRGLDVRIDWHRPSTPSKVSAFANDVATTILEQITATTGLNREDKMQATLVQSLEAFMQFCEEHLDAIEGYHARIIASRGSSATKCPAWHQDHVPVRWIQSLYGPGCQWVDTIENWSTADESEDDEGEDSSLHESLTDLNQRRVNHSMKVRQASPGKAVILIGKGWREFAKGQETRDLPAVVHKSPPGMRPWQGRVLLTIDVTLKNEARET